MGPAWGDRVTGETRQRAQEPRAAAADAARGARFRTVTVSHHPSSAAIIRRELTADLSDHAGALSPEFFDDAAVVATELVGNAVRHARALDGGVIEVDWRAYPDGVAIRVIDGGSPQAPTIRRVAPESVTGRGLAIVAALSARWGVTPVEQGRCVWAWLGRATRVAS